MRSRSILICLWLWSCSSAAEPARDAGSVEAGTSDAGGPDSEATPEAGPRDAAPFDAAPSDAGILDGASPDVGTSTAACGAVSFSPAPSCAECQVNHCCTVAQNCADNPECQAAFDCQSQCTDAACRRACQTTHAAGVWDFSGLYVCLQNNCPSQCGFPAAMCGGITLTTATCNTCFRNRCCAEGSACGAEDQCLALIYQCLDENGCPDSDGNCAQRCRRLYPEGADEFDASLACARAQCPSECAGL